MALKISSWIKSGKEELILTCEADVILNVNNEEKKPKYCGDIDFVLRWN